MRRIFSLVILALVTACGAFQSTGPEGVADPAAAQIVTSDLAHFWAAYDAGASSSAFQSQYLDAASAGLRDFIGARALTATSLSQMVATYPKYFASIRTNNLNLAIDGTIVARIRANFATIKSLYPEAVFPPVTFLIGRFSTGGTTSASGMLIGSEFYSTSLDTPIGELGQFQRDNVKGIDSIPIIVAHEHGHVLQARAGGVWAHSNKNLLELAMLEGGADFIGEQSSGGNINRHMFPYGLAHEAALWAEFKLVMHGTDVSKWLYNQGTATGDRPGDLGYFIGYRIAESFYARQADKKAALKALIEMNDADGFLALSGYGPT